MTNSIDPDSTLLTLLGTNPPAIVDSPDGVDYSTLPRDLRRAAKGFLVEIDSYDFSGTGPAELLALAQGLSSAADGLNQAYVFAIFGELAARILNQRPYLVQYLAAWVATRGYLAEMYTGEGKTLALGIAAAWLALSEGPTHVMTANDYLAERDANWLEPFFRFLGLSVGVTLNSLDPAQRARAYACSVTYGTAQQFGFDYLVDHLTYDPASLTGAPRNWALLDEADSLMLDEARTPLIISGQPQPDESLSIWADWARSLPSHAYDTDEIDRQVWLTPTGIAMAERATNTKNLYDHPSLVAQIQAALHAEVLLKRDRDYLVEQTPDGPVASIIDESTGRVLKGRRWQGGIHEAVEAKESIPVHYPAPTLASVTIPEFLGLYEHLGATTGTAWTSRDEFAHLYDIEVVVVPRRLASLRIDLPDLLYLSKQDKFAAIVAATRQLVSASRPVLIGAPTVAEAELLSTALTEAGLAHQLLSARHPHAEAAIIAQAGRANSITVATNMAGRGVDIILGGPDGSAQERDQVIAAGGLAVLSTARHSSKRVDLQLKGRCARQGEPGSTRGYLSLDDELLAGVDQSKLRSAIQHLAPSPKDGAEGKLLDSLIDELQSRYELAHTQQRAQLAAHNKVISAQRTEIYRYRDLLLTRSWTENLVSWYTLADEHSVLLDPAWPFIDDPLLDALTGELVEPDTLENTESNPDEMDNNDSWIEPYVPPIADDLEKFISQLLDDFVARSKDTDDHQRSFGVSYVLATTLDASWQHQMSNLETLRDGIHLRRLAARSPEAAFSIEAHALFERMMTRMLAIGVSRLNSMVLSAPASQ